MNYDGEDIPVETLSPAEQGALAGEREAARIDAEDQAAAESGMTYSDEQQPDADDTNYPLHHDNEETEPAERPEGSGFEADTLAAASEAFSTGDFTDSPLGDLLDERAILSDGGDYTARGREAILDMLTQQNITLSGNKIMVGGQHVADAKLSTVTNDSGVTRITKIAIKHLGG